MSFLEASTIAEDLQNSSQAGFLQLFDCPLQYTDLNVMESVYIYVNLERQKM